MSNQNAAKSLHIKIAQLKFGASLTDDVYLKFN